MDLDSLVGMKLFDAVDVLQHKVTGHGIKSVIAVKIDGEPTLITANYDSTRLQVETEKNVITRIVGRG